MKLAKLSLAAIMTVGALSTSAMAMDEVKMGAFDGSLDKAIRGVDLNGYAHYRFHDASDAEAYTEIEVRAQLTAPVQENIKFTTRFTADNTSATNETSGSADPLVDRLMLTYTGFDKTSVTLGRMYAGTPLDDTAALGLKVVTSPMAGLTLAAAYFTDHSAITNATASAAVIYSNEMFNARAWYTNQFSENSNANNDAKYVFLEAGVNVGPVAVKAQYATADRENLVAAIGAQIADEKASTMRIQASAKFDMIGLRAGYIQNDEDGGDVTIDASSEGDNDLIYGGIFGLVQNNVADGESVFAEAKYSAGKFGVKAGYVSYDNMDFDSQYYGQIDFQMTKKLSTYVRYGSADTNVVGDEDKTLARFHAQYSF